MLRGIQIQIFPFRVCLQRNCAGLGNLTGQASDESHEKPNHSNLQNGFLNFLPYKSLFYMMSLFCLYLFYYFHLSGCLTKLTPWRHSTS